MSIETTTSRLVKKTGVEKSRWTVPLNVHRSEIFIRRPQWSAYFLSVALTNKGSIPLNWYPNSKITSQHDTSMGIDGCQSVHLGRASCCLWRENESKKISVGGTVLSRFITPVTINMLKFAIWNLFWLVEKIHFFKIIYLVSIEQII
jgi:hypothetical protein